MYSKLSELNQGNAAPVENDKVKRQDNKKTILIVEDFGDIAFFLSCILEKYGDIDIAHNGQQALIKSALNDYDLIVSDVNMPVMDGIKFYKAVAGSFPDIKSRFLFFTSSFDRDHINFFIENNVPFLHKPAPIEDIETAVNKILYGSYGGLSEDAGTKKNILLGM